MREGNVQDALVREAKRYRVWAIKAEHLVVGFPDMLLLAPGGRFALVELKAPGRTLRIGQRIVRKWMRRLGITVHVFDTPEEVKAFFKSWLG